MTAIFADNRGLSLRDLREIVTERQQLREKISKTEAALSEAQVAIARLTRELETREAAVTEASALLGVDGEHLFRKALAATYTRALIGG